MNGGLGWMYVAAAVAFEAPNNAKTLTPPTVELVFEDLSPGCSQ